ncbi:hypothetical protein AGMMS49928_12850 [Spirochaetia bacterium]|nr:hypothetical protein AGMMS49928_12850 [Spirochaetia bacterium]
MNVALEFSPSAFKHSVSEADIRNAFMNALYDDILDEFTDKHILLGCDRNGNILEIMYNLIDENSRNVFHAMKCRSIFYPLLDDYWRTVWRE